MSQAPLTVVIVGGVAGGASAATRARRLNEEAEIILFEKDEHVSFANCGLPYYLGGEITDRNKLLVATSDFLSRRFRLDVRTRQEVVAIDRERNAVTVKNHRTGETYRQSYGKLILAPGAEPVIPPFEGISSRNVFTLRNLDDTDAIHDAMQTVSSKKAVVVGAGYIGLEMVEQLVEQEFEVSLVELQNQVLPLLDPEMARPLEQQLRGHGVNVHLGKSCKRIRAAEDGTARAVELEDGTEVDASLVIVGVGVHPLNKLARNAELELGKGGGILTNEHRQTNDPDIYAVGDAAEYCFGPTGDAMCVPLAGPANRAGRLAGEHAVTDASAPMADVYGTSIVRVFDQAAGVTGLTTKMAERLGVNAKSVTIVSKHHAGYYPGATPVTLKLLFDPDEGRVLGAQAVGPNGIDKRIDVIATAMKFQATAHDLTGLDLAYAPPFGAAKDPVHMAAFAACNQLNGITDFIEPDADLSQMQVLDVRTPPELEKWPFPGAPHAKNIPLDELRDRLDELDMHAETAVFCQVSLRAHVASCILRQSGFENVHVISGGTIVRTRAVPEQQREADKTV